MFRSVGFNLLLGIALPALAQAPGAVTGLRACPGAEDCWLWDADPAATSYTVYRGTGATLPFLLNATADSCAAVRQAAPLAIPVHPAAPASGLSWYLVSGRNGGGEGPAGGQVNATGWCCDEPAYAERFAANGPAWPAYVSVSGNVQARDVTGGMARWRPDINYAPWPYALARQVIPVNEQDAEATFTIAFEDVARQGIGFYLRSNGGYLAPGNPPNVGPLGLGYGVFIEGFRAPQRIGLWYEQNGVEIEMTYAGLPNGTLVSGVRYRVRYRVTQLNATTTRLQAKLWPESGAEPAGWTVTRDDSTIAALQNRRGVIAIDSYTHAGGSAFASIDDIALTRLCGPAWP